MPEKEKVLGQNEGGEWQEENQYCLKTIFISQTKEIIPRPKQIKTKETKE